MHIDSFYGVQKMMQVKCANGSVRLIKSMY